MAIGTVWADDTWDDDAWADDTWADAGAATIVFTDDVNALLYRFLCNEYSVTSGDLTQMITRYTGGLSSGDATQRFQQMIANAIAASQ